MSAPQTLIQAALQRLGARLGSGLVDAAASLAVLAQDTPEKLRQEWVLFCEEVEQEAERLERQQAGGDGAPGPDWAEPSSAGDAAAAGEATTASTTASATAAGGSFSSGTSSAAAAGAAGSVGAAPAGARSSVGSHSTDSDSVNPNSVSPNTDPQEQIDSLRARIASLARRLEQRP